MPVNQNCRSPIFGSRHNFLNDFRDGAGTFVGRIQEIDRLSKTLGRLFFARKAMVCVKEVQSKNSAMLSSLARENTFECVRSLDRDTYKVER